MVKMEAGGNTARRKVRVSIQKKSLDMRITENRTSTDLRRQVNELDTIKARL